MKIDELYYDNNTIHSVNAMIKRYKMNLDNLVVVTGREGSGKSSFAIGLCHLYAKEMGVKFEVDDITFSAQEFLQRATHKKSGIVLYDEAVQGLMTTQWQNKTQQLIVQALMMARKNRNLYVLCIPSFEYLNKYIATERCFLLFNCFMHEGRRGFANIYTSKNPMTMKQLYHQCKTLSANRLKSKWKLRFLDHSDKVIDKDAYELKKDQAIQKLTSALTNDNSNVYVNQKKYYAMITHYGTKAKELQKIQGYSQSQAYRDLQGHKEYMESLSTKGTLDIAPKTDSK